MRTRTYDEEFRKLQCTKTNLKEVATQAIENASFVCEDFYNIFAAPKVELKCPDDLLFMYIPSHLVRSGCLRSLNLYGVVESRLTALDLNQNHILFEILKNSLRATVERFGPDCDKYPPIQVIVAKGKEDITIKVSDEGGGIARTDMPNVWTYM